MKRNNDYLIKTFYLMDKLQKFLNLEIDLNDRYNSILKELNSISSKENCIKNKNKLLLNQEFRKEIEDYLYSMDINKLNKKIGNFNHLNVYGFSIEDESKIPEEELSVLTDIYLIRFLVSFLKCISYIQKEDLLLVKYSKSIWNFGHNNLTKISRGKVFNIHTKEIVAYPFDKFFNLNECEETSFDKMEQLLLKAKHIYTMDKADGSTIIVTKRKNDILINTNGGFNNLQIDLAKNLLKEKYQYFLDNMKSDYTYIFELIHPKDSKVVNYNGAKKLILLAIRNLSNQRLLRYDECVNWALELKLDIVKSFKFTSLKDFVSMAHTVEGTNREGWVFRVITDKEDTMFKLKFDEYCVLHRNILGKIKPYDIYSLMKNDMLDDVLSKSDENSKVLILETVEQINHILSMIENNIEESLQYLKSNFDITKEEYQECLLNRIHPKYETKVNLMKFIHQEYSKKLLNIDGITAYYKNGISPYDYVNSIDPIKFKMLCKKNKLFKLEEN